MSDKRPEELARKLVTLDRKDLITILRGLQCAFEVDFTDEFLQSVSVERLRHIVLAASLHTRAAGG